VDRVLERLLGGRDRVLPHPSVSNRATVRPRARATERMCDRAHVP
jgi:hypothetical protein